MNSFKAILIGVVVLGMAGIAHSDTGKHGKGAIAVDPAAYAAAPPTEIAAIA